METVAVRTWFDRTEKDKKKEKAKERRRLKKKLKRCGGLLYDKRRREGLVTEYPKTVPMKVKRSFLGKNVPPGKQKEERTPLGTAVEKLGGYEDDDRRPGRWSDDGAGAR